MPRYDFECGKCGSVEEYFAANLQEKIPCPCGGVSNALFPMVNITGTLKFNLPYNVAAGKKFYSTKEQDRWMKKNRVEHMGNSKPKPKNTKMPEITKKDMKDWGLL